jgi:DNA-binding transcriptional ArsR family regulator
VRGKLRIHFTAEDLARTRVAARPDPLWELVLSLHKIGTSTGGLAFEPWRRVVSSVAPAHRPKVNRGMVRELVPRRGDFPDFLTPPEAELGLDGGIEAIMHAPKVRLNADLEFIARTRALPAWTRDLAASSPTALSDLGRELRAYHDVYLAPFWPVIRAHVDADRALRARAFLDGGCEAVLASLRPAARWERPVLEASYPVDWDVHLGGRGLTLVPNYFCWHNPVTLIDQDCSRPVLIYPVDHDLTLSAAVSPVAGPARKRLAALLGRTRGAILLLLADMCSTGEIARRFGLSAATVSLHTTALREAGLITTRRDGHTSLHVLSPLGTALCHSCGLS